MVNKNSRTNTGGGVNVHAEGFRNPILQTEGQGLTVLLPQPVSHAVGFERVKTLIVQQGRRIERAGRVTVTHRADVRPNGPTNLWVIHQRFHDDVA